MARRGGDGAVCGVFGGAFLVYPNEWFQWIPFVYLLALYLLFTMYMSVAVRHYERWLNDNYADLEYKRVWLSQVVGFFFLLLFILYMLVETNFVLVGLLLWRVESLPSLTSDPSPKGEGSSTTSQKTSMSSQTRLTSIVEKWHSLLPNAEILPISAKNKFGVDILLKRIHELLPESPAYFDKDQLTDKPARFFVSEIIREKILLYYDKEIPYSVEVSVERFKETDKNIHINAVIYVERDSQKGIIIGHQGIALKKVSTEARKSLEKFFDKPIYLETFVKVDKDWRSSQRELDHFGYNPE